MKISSELVAKFGLFLEKHGTKTRCFLSNNYYIDIDDQDTVPRYEMFWERNGIKVPFCHGEIKSEADLIYQIEYAKICDRL